MSEDNSNNLGGEKSIVSELFLLSPEQQAAHASRVEIKSLFEFARTKSNTVNRDNVRPEQNGNINTIELYNHNKERVAKQSTDKSTTESKTSIYYHNNSSERGYNNLSVTENPDGSFLITHFDSSLEKTSTLSSEGIAKGKSLSLDMLAHALQKAHEEVGYFKD